MTKKVKDRAYEEVIFPYSVEEATNHLKKEISKAAEAVRELGHIPCFCTIPPMSLERWNKVRLQQGKTTHLKHQHKYNNMQTKLLLATININKFIHQTNEEHNMKTPKIAEHIFKNEGSKRGYRFRYGKLVDGVHPAPSVVTEWALELLDGTINNHSMHKRK